MLHVVVGDVGEYLSYIAKDIDPTAKLCINPDVEDGVVYTSLADLTTIKNLHTLFKKANIITYCPPEHWSDGKTRLDYYSQAWTVEHYLHIAKNCYNVQVNNLSGIPSLDGIDWNNPPPGRQTNSRQIWSAGCSTTFGIGVNDSERYAHLVSTHLNLPYTMLARRGTSNVWSAGQILQSDIKTNDIVIWGVTHYGRFPWVDSKKLFHITASTFTEYPELAKKLGLVDILDCETRLYEDILAFNQVINFCQKVKARLILIGIHVNIELATYLTKHKDFIMAHGENGFESQSSYLDLGSDNSHPGPKTHKMYAEKIIEHIGKDNA